MADKKKGAQVNPALFYKVPSHVLQGVIDYLSSRPYRETYKLISMLLAMPKIGDPNQKETKPVEKK